MQVKIKETTMTTKMLQSIHTKHASSWESDAHNDDDDAKDDVAADDAVDPLQCGAL